MLHQVDEIGLSETPDEKGELPQGAAQDLFPHVDFSNQ
jgi:hypothetical protein